MRDGICVDPPLCLGSSQGKFGSCAKGLGREGESVGKVGEVGERELVLVVSVRCRKERNNYFETQRCAILSDACSRDEM